MTAISEREAKEWQTFFADREVICGLCGEQIDYNERGGWCSITEPKTQKVRFFHMDCWDEHTDYKFPGAERPEKK